MSDIVRAFHGGVHRLNEDASPQNLVRLDVDQPIWDRFFTVAPLVVVGSRGADGTYDLAPKHMVTPLFRRGDEA